MGYDLGLIILTCVLILGVLMIMLAIAALIGWVDRKNDAALPTPYTTWYQHQIHNSPQNGHAGATTVANSIFVGPQYTGTAADSPRVIEEKLNADFAALFSSNPSLSSQRQIIHMTVSSESPYPDSVAVTQSKINSMLKVLGDAANLTLTPVTLDAASGQPGGVTSAAANQLTLALSQLGGVSTLGALGLSTTAVTRSVAFTANVTGTTTGSTLNTTGLPTGLVLNSGPRTITGTTAVTAGSYPIVVTETKAGAFGSPKTNNFTLVVT